MSARRGTSALSFTLSDFYQNCQIFFMSFLKIQRIFRCSKGRFLLFVPGPASELKKATCSWKLNNILLHQLPNLNKNSST